LVDWVVSNGGSVNGVAMANLAGSDGGSGWGLVATQVRRRVQDQVFRFATGVAHATTYSSSSGLDGMSSAVITVHCSGKKTKQHGSV
jgi:hypothetical protein